MSLDFEQRNDLIRFVPGKEPSVDSRRPPRGGKAVLRPWGGRGRPKLWLNRKDKEGAGNVRGRWSPILQWEKEMGEGSLRTSFLQALLQTQAASGLRAV